MSQQFYQQRFTVAPMLDWTTRHCRAFHRMLSKHAVLYTEMVAANTIIYSKGDPLYFRKEYEGDVILQVGGSDPQQCAQIARMLQENADRYPYAGINLNVGCPSPRVVSGSFGACLMAEPQLVADCMKAFQDNCDLPLSIKTRIGIDDIDDFDFLDDFIMTSADIGINEFVIHARKAYLQGLSPKENREVPPLNYERVYDIKEEHPELKISINGGINTLKDARQHLQTVDGVMMGREAYNNPAILLGVDPLIFEDYNNEYSRLNIIFDDTFQTDQRYRLNPDLYGAVGRQADTISSRMYSSLQGGFNNMNGYNPLLEKADVLRHDVYTYNRHRHQLNLERMHRFAIEFEQQKYVPSRHAPKSEVSDVARLQRLQIIAETQAMFIALDKMRDYWMDEAQQGTAISHLFKPILSAFNGVPGARQFRRYLSDNGFKPDSSVDEIFYALDLMYDRFIHYTESSF